jgi:hypothetical protein
MGWFAVGQRNPHRPIDVCSVGRTLLLRVGEERGSAGKFAAASAEPRPDRPRTSEHPESPPRQPRCFLLSSQRTIKSLHPHHFHLPNICLFQRTMVP